MFRIVSEAVTNVVRHANARECRVSVRVRTGALEATIEDDGRGIAPDVAEGVGMRSMRERAGEVGGTVTVTGLRRGGTRVSVALPLGGLA